ncbi:hypothetical protein SAMN02745163_03670 [Clostridium cavendishii DSM 21758]|uniref:Uncharacterized protein n=1 Tax=Clostridium cavendishii DSM 21758 TaxID=1121302 RepID=A0A1M6RUG4_9CLOT|nr:small acid-soluble spore protein [Clostridium cavendishii]SHK35937.1 hypothetical protein SAMN02745163_03670 [Clostridium cavendishii DSM 21758]
MSPNNRNYKGLVPQLREGLYRPRNEVTSKVELENYKENFYSKENTNVDEEIVKKKVED